MILKAQTKWGWFIAAYLFLAGVGGGAYVTGAVAGFGGPEWTLISKIGVLLSFPCVGVGCLFLILDLGSPKNFWRSAMKPATSWIARGTIVITIFMILGVLHAGLWIWPSQMLDTAQGLHTLISVLGILFAFGTMIYTGILLGAARPLAFWSTAMLPLLFLVSALSTGIMAVIFIGSLAGAAGHALLVLGKIDLLIILQEIFVLGFYLQATHRVRESRASARLVLAGSSAPLFWLGVVCLGLLVPLAFDLLTIYALSGPAGHTLGLLASCCGLLGGLFLRKVVLSGGIYAPLAAGRFEYALTNI